LESHLFGIMAFDKIYQTDFNFSWYLIGLSFRFITNRSAFGGLKFRHDTTHCMLQKCVTQRFSNFFDHGPLFSSGIVGGPPHFKVATVTCSSDVRVLARDTKCRGFDYRAFHFHVTTLGKLFTHVCLCHQAVQFGTGQGAVMPCGWEGNRRSGVALAMQHRLQWFIHLRVHGLDREISTPPTLSCRVWPIYLHHSSDAGTGLLIIWRRTNFKGLFAAHELNWTELNWTSRYSYITL